MAEAQPLIDKNYMEEHFLRVYLEDAVAQLLSHRQEGATSPSMKPCKFFKEYFTSVHQGTHVLFREYSFVSATSYNRICVLRAITQIYKSMLHREEKYNFRDYHSTLQLVWPDFPVQVVQDAFAAYEDEKKDDYLHFLDFIKAMRSSFCTGELDYEAGIIADQLDEKIEEFSKIPLRSVEASGSVNEAESAPNVEEDAAAAATGKHSPFVFYHIMDGSELKRVLNLNDSNSVSSDEPISGGKLSRSSSESREASKSEKKKKTKKTGAAKGKIRGRMAGKHLSNSLNLLQSGKTDADGKKIKRRNRSKSAAASSRNPLKKPPWR